MSMWRKTDYNDKAVKEICYDCGSPVAKKSYNYFRRANYRAGQAHSTVWCMVFYLQDETPVAFYYAYKCVRHVRLVEIAVRTEYKRQGIGKMVLFQLLSRMKQNRLDTLTFRTPINEDAQNFWLKMGAKIIDVKGSDYEMELKIKL